MVANAFTVVQMINNRLTYLRKRMHAIAVASKAQQQQQQVVVRRRSGDVTPRSVPT
jgi:serine/threonine-protein kinase ULK/ATG1